MIDLSGKQRRKSEAKRPGRRTHLLVAAGGTSVQGVD